MLELRVTEAEIEDEVADIIQKNVRGPTRCAKAQSQGVLGMSHEVEAEPRARNGGRGGQRLEVRRPWDKAIYAKRTWSIETVGEVMMWSDTTSEGTVRKARTSTRRQDIRRA